MPHYIVTAVQIEKSLLEVVAHRRARAHAPRVVQRRRTRSVAGDPVSPRTESARRCPIAPRCNPFGTPACNAPARVLYVAPDGEPVPGGYACAKHGAATVAEYAEKMGERWELVPLLTTDDHGATWHEFPK